MAQINPGKLEASILVIDPGIELYSACGHAAIRMQAPLHELDICFSYLVDELDHPLFSTLYKGNFQGLVAIPMDEYTFSLETEGRGFDEYTLNLTNSEKQELWHLLDTEWRKGMYIDYDFIHSGCALRLHNILMQICKDEEMVLRTNASLSSQSVKTLISSHLYGRYEVAFLMSFVIDDETNDCQFPYKELIIPNDMAKIYSQSYIKDKQNNIRPLISKYDRWTPSSVSSLHSSNYTSLINSVLIATIFVLSIASAVIHQLRGSSLITRIADIWDILIIAISTLLAFFLLSIEIFSPLNGTKYNSLLLVYNLLPATGIVLHALKMQKFAKLVLFGYLLSLITYIIISIKRIAMETWFILPHYILGIAILICTYEIYNKYNPSKT